MSDWSTSSWIDRRDLKRLQQSPPAYFAEAAPSHADHSSGPASFDGIEIDGSPEFTTATERALARLRSTSAWPEISKLHRIREERNPFSSAGGGYLFGGEFTVGPDTWRQSETAYAGDIAHDAHHLALGHGYGNAEPKEEERIAFQRQIEVLRELGAPGHEIAECQRHARNPTHQEGFARDWNAQFGK